MEHPSSPVHAVAEWLLVRRVAADLSALETVVLVGAAAGTPSSSRIPEGERPRLERWLRDGAPKSWGPAEWDPLREALAPLQGPVIAGPIRWRGEVPGLLVVGARSPLVGLSPLVGELLGLFAAALAADDPRPADVAPPPPVGIVGADTGLGPVMERVRRVAPTQAPVLIFGETGSGREVVARAVHDASARAGGPFLRVSCGAASTGDSDAWFEQADGGTLFLDGVGELPPSDQVRLLRVLQDGASPRGDVRIVATTDRDLLASGTFRKDLWYRISVFPIRIPPLRERAGDIPALAGHFAANVGLRLFGRALAPDPADIDLLRACRWPGNVRELAVVIERAAILGNGRRLDVAAALAGSRGQPADHDERPRIYAALEHSHGRIEGPFGAADRLGVNPHTLRSRMRRLGIDWQRFRK